MKIAQRVLEKRLGVIVELNEMQLGLMPGEEMVHALFIAKRLQEEYPYDRNLQDRKFYLWLVDLVKGFDRVPRNVVE